MADRAVRAVLFAGDGAVTLSEKMVGGQVKKVVAA